MSQVLIMSFWNPTTELPSKGLFIHEQVKAICSIRKDIIFLEINILPSKRALFNKETKDLEFYENRKITLNIYSFLWKLIFYNPWLLCSLIKRELQKKYPHFKPILIHSNIIFPCGIVGHLLAKKLGSKQIISEHWSKVKEMLKHPVYKKLAIDTYRNSKAIICVSRFMAENFRQSIGTENILIVPNIIDTDLYRYQPKQNKNQNTLIFSCAAYWEKPKRLDLIIKSVAAFAKGKNKYITLKVIGAGSQRDEFINAEYIENLKVEWVGYIPKSNVAKILWETDFFLHASETETFSIVTVEALSTGTPVLASNVGAIPELINSTNGILVDNNLEAWIKGLHEITERKYVNLTIATDVSGKYSPASVATKIEEIYERILLS